MNVQKYCESRLKSIDAESIHPLREGKKWEDETIFRTGDDGIDIHYFNQRGNPYYFNTEGARWNKRYVRTRLAEPKGSMKYRSKKGAGVNPFFTPRLQYLYQSRTEVELLVLTEGEFKSFVASKEKHPIDCMGLNGFTGYIEEAGSQSIHPDILDFIIVCKVKRVILLTDADTLVVEWKKGKDLTKRQKSFAAAVDKWIEIGKTLIDNPKTEVSNVYFGHIKSKYNEMAKGLDDLILHHDHEKADIKADLYELNFANKYFDIKDVSKVKSGFSKKYFSLNSSEDFYRQYKRYIGDKEFLFYGNVYEWDGEKVQFIRVKDTDKYIRVETDWFKLVQKPNKEGLLQEEIVPWKVSELQRDYKHLGDKFINSLAKYDYFINEPAWKQGTYQRAIHDGYNICNPLVWEPKEGTFHHIMSYLMHVFGTGNEVRHYEYKKYAHDKPSKWWTIECVDIGNQFTVAMDWLTLLIQHPKQMLPVPILVSEEQVTGKTTFLKLLCEIFSGNGVIINNEQFKNSFNAHYITKYIIGLDEGFLDMDKKSEKERLKQLVTSPEQQMNDKGIRLKKFLYYGKLVICSNDADSVMRMDEQDTRWFVVKVPTIKKKDPDLEKKMMKEIPAFLDFLFNRTIAHPKQDRLWFKTEHFITDQFREVVENTRPQYQQDIEEYIKWLFLDVFKTASVKAGVNDIIKGVNRTSRFKIDAKRVKEYIVKTKKLNNKGNSSYYVPTEYVDEQGEPTTIVMKGRYWNFYAHDWLTAEEQKSIGLIKSDEPKEEQQLAF